MARSPAILLFAPPYGRIAVLSLAFLLAGAAPARAGLWAASYQERPLPPAVVVPVEKIADDFGRDLAWVVGSHAADLYSTSWALSRCGTECVEGNFLGPTTEARLALKMASVASAGLTIWKLRRDGHGKTATVIRWAYVAVNGALAVNNTVHAIRRK